MFKKFTIYNILITIILSIILPCTSVLAEEKDSPAESSESKVIYITFDDGISCKITPKILDTLKKEEVPATFFLIGETLDDNQDILKRMVDEGHSVGLHTYTHERNKIYRSKEAFLDEMLKTQNKIYEITSVKTNILRFPFGVNNTSFHINKDWETFLHNKGFMIYDWNVDTADGANPKSSVSTIYKKAMSDQPHIILLMHCTNLHNNTSAALPKIIKHYKDAGYEFKKIDETTPEMYRIHNKKVINFVY